MSVEMPSNLCLGNRDSLLECLMYVLDDTKVVRLLVVLLLLLGLNLLVLSQFVSQSVQVIEWDQVQFLHRQEQACGELR